MIPIGGDSVLAKTHGKYIYNQSVGDVVCGGGTPGISAKEFKQNCGVDAGVSYSVGLCGDKALR